MRTLAIISIIEVLLIIALYLAIRILINLFKEDKDVSSNSKNKRKNLRN